MNEHPQRSIRSFVLRSGRMTASQEKAFAELWPRYGLSLEDGRRELDSVFGRRAPRVLEIGFGMGDSLAQMAQAAPELDFIGVEVHRPGVGRLLRLAHEAGLTNMRLYCADAIEVLTQALPEESLQRVQLFFPDPWHKKRHHKRRIVNPDFVALVQSRLATGGTLHIATDWQNYAESILDVMAAFPALQNAAGANHYMPKPDYRPLTKFEQRGQRLGHGIWDLVFTKK